VDADGDERLRTREQDVLLVRRRFVPLGTGRPAREVQHEVALPVDRELRAVVQSDVDLSLEQVSKLLVRIRGNGSH